MEEIAAAARRYISIFGTAAIYRVEADLSRAIGQKRWEDYARLRKVRLRIQRLKAISAAGAVSLTQTRLHTLKFGL